MYRFWRENVLCKESSKSKDSELGYAGYVQGPVVIVSFPSPVPLGQLNTGHLWTSQSSVLEPDQSNILRDAFQFQPFYLEISNCQQSVGLLQRGRLRLRTDVSPSLIAMGRWPHPQASSVSGYHSCLGCLLMQMHVAAWVHASGGSEIIHKC